MAVLLNVDKEKVDVTVGRTSIQRDKAVVLAWNKSQQNLQLSSNDGGWCILDNFYQRGCSHFCFKNDTGSAKNNFYRQFCL